MSELQKQNPVAWQHRNGTLSCRRPGGRAGFEWVPLYARPVPAEEGIVTVTTNDAGRCVMVSRQDEDHRILSVIWEAEDVPTEPVTVDFGKRGKNMFFKIGNQSFLLDYKPEEPGEFEFMKAMLLSAFSRITHGVKTESQPVNARILDVSTGKLEHINAGLCPDSINGPDSRDPATDWADRIKARGQK